MSLVHLLALIACTPEIPEPIFEMQVGPPELHLQAAAGDCAEADLEIDNTGTMAGSATIHTVVQDDCPVDAWRVAPGTLWLSSGGRATTPVRYCPEIPGTCDVTLAITLAPEVGSGETIEIALSGDATSADDDRDGFRVADGDCDDTDANVHPGALEVVNDVDDDCDGLIDEGTEVYDDDGDGEPAQRYRVRTQALAQPRRPHLPGA